MSLNTWIFQRKLMIETYKPNICSLYKMMLLQLHPLLAIAWNYDITLMRVDRAIALILRVVLCLPASYISLLFLVEFSDLWSFIIASAAMSIILLPLPAWVFNSCRVKYRLKNEIMSLEQPGEIAEKKIYINSNLTICQLMMIDQMPYKEIKESLITIVKKMSKVQLEQVVEINADQ